MYTEDFMRPQLTRVYRSFQDFEREELRKFDILSSSIEEMLDDMLVCGLKLNDRATEARQHDDLED